MNYERKRRRPRRERRTRTMALRTIVLEGDSCLTKVCRPVTKFDDRLAQLIDDMKETMYANDGCGLAAVQVGILKRVVVLDVGEGPIELVNPEIIFRDGEQREAEGCLSIPGEYGTTVRPAVVKVKAQDRNGKWQVLKGEGLKARCFCHEIDHLDGILFTQRLADPMENKEIL